MILTLAFLLLCGNMGWAESNNPTPVKGVVLDSAGQPITGAFVLQKATSNGTISFQAGKVMNTEYKWDSAIWDLNGDEPKLR